MSLFSVRRFPVALVTFPIVMAAASAQADLTAVPSFVPADSARVGMDVGGTWNGVSEVLSGDIFSIEITNDGDDVAFDLDIEATLPVGFIYAAGSASGIPGLSATQSGQTLTFNVPMDTDLGAGAAEAISFGLVAGTTVTAGTYSVNWDVTFGTTDGAADGLATATEDVLVRAGASLLTTTPIQQSAAVGDTVVWDATITSTGLGGLFDVTLDGSALVPTNSAGSLTFVSMVETDPGGTGILSGSTYTFPYLGPDASATVRFTATVSGCDAIENQVATTDRTGLSAGTIAATVSLDLTQPLIAITTSGLAPTFTALDSFNGQVQNTGVGSASGLQIDSSLETLGVTVSNVSSDWTYTPATGVFTYVAAGGVLGNGATSTLTFDAAPSDPCAAMGGGIVVWAPTYQNVCGDPYATPVVTSSLSGVTDRPSISVAIGANERRLEVTEAGVMTVTLQWTERDLIGTNPLEVDIQLAPELLGVTPGAPSVGSVSTPSGNAVTWSIDRSSLTSAGSLDLVIGFNAPSNPCEGGNDLVSTASVAASSVPSLAGSTCSLNATSAEMVLITNAPTGPLTQLFDVGVPPGGTWETGRFDDGDGLREDAVGEGEFISYTATYEFGAPFTGTWAGSSFKDFLGGLDDPVAPLQALVAGSAMAVVNSGAPVLLAVSPPDSGESGFKIDLAQLQAAAGGGANLEGSEVIITYQTVVRDEFLAGTTGQFTELVQLTVGSAAGDAAACNMGEYTQGAFVNVARAQALVSVDVPGQLDTCEEFDLVLTVSNGTPERASNVLVTFDTSGDYEFIAGQTPTYGGVFNAGNITFAENLNLGVATMPTFTFDPSLELTGSGTISFRARRAAGSAAATTGASATVDYDDQQTQPDAARAFRSFGSDAPFLVREAALNLTVTPQSLTVIGTTAQWRIDVTNGGSGVAYEALLTDILPAGLTPNKTLTDAQNAIPAEVLGQTMSWDLGNLNPGEGQTLTVIADVGAGACDVLGGANSIDASWGCGPIRSQVAGSADPALSFPSGALQVLHDTGRSEAVICASTGEFVLIVKSVGGAHVIDVSVTEDLQTATSGLSYVPGSSTFSTDGTTFTAITGTPTVTGSGAVTWDKDEIAVLADLASASEREQVREVHIRFLVSASEDANLLGGEVTMGATGTEPCGDPVAAQGNTFTVPLLQPEMTVVAVVQNATTGGPVGDRATGVPGDIVRWTVTLDNAGAEQARNTRLRAVLPGLGAGTATLTFPNASSQSIPSNTWVTIADVAAGATEIYTIEYPLDASCVDDGAFVSEVTWGCSAAAGSNPAALSTPADNDDGATVDMEPDFSGSGLTQSMTRLSNSRVEIAVTMTNGGAPASSLLVDLDLAGFELDTTYASTVTGDLSLTSVTFPTAEASEPRFQLGGTLGEGETATIRLQVIPTQGLDSESSARVEPETVGDGDSPATVNGSSNATVEYSNACGATGTRSRTSTINPHVPDLDLFIDLDEVVVVSGDTYQFNFTIQNTGEGGSVAENVVFVPAIGAAWSAVTTEVVTPGTGGTGGACGGTCTELQIGSLGRLQSAVVRITATANDNGGSLAMSGSVLGSLFTNDGTDTGGDYSLDVRTSAVVGYQYSQVIVSTSEAFTADPGTPRLAAVGEEVTFQFEGRWFGGAAISGIEIKDTLPAALGFVSSVDVASTMGYSLFAGSAGTTPAAAGDTGELRFVLADLPGGAGTFQANIVARVLNVDTASESIVTNPSGVRFDGLGVTFHSNNAQDGYTGDVPDPDLHAATTVQVNRAELEVTTLVRNVTAGQVTFSTSAMGDAGDELQFRTIVTNVGVAPAFDVVVTEDPATSKLLIQGGASDGVDNDGDGAVDEADEGTFAVGVDGLVTFDGNDNSALDRLDPSDTVTFLYGATVAGTSEPEETLANSAVATGASLDGGTGNQSGVVGDLGDSDGAEEISGSDSADLLVDMIDFSKALISTSEGSDTSVNVVVGEVLHFRLLTVLPEGQASAFRLIDTLDAGLALRGTPAVSFGWAGPGQPTVTPGALPASGAPLLVTYSFGTLSIPAGTALQRTITVDYFVQVENVASNVAGKTLDNAAQWAFGSTTGTAETVTVTVVEPALALTQLVTGSTPADAGSVLTYTVSVTNGGTAAAQDVDLRFALPPGTVYVPGSTSGTVGPVIDEPEVNGSTVIWGRTQGSPGVQDIDLPGGGGSNLLSYTFQVLLTDAVEPAASLLGTTSASWTSLDGAGTSLGGILAQATGSTYGERDGSGAANDYAVSDSDAFAAQNAYGNRVVASGDSLAGGGFRVGDLVTYTVELDLQEGTTDAVVLTETLPPGLSFHDSQAITPGSGSNGFTFTQPTGGNAPSAGDTGAIAWALGTVVNAGDNDVTNDTLVLVYRARVLDTGGVLATPTTSIAANSVQLTYDNAAEEPQAVTAATDAVDIKQPLLAAQLTLAPGQAVIVGAGDPVRFEATLGNDGDAPAYNASLRVTLPVYLRNAAPTTVAATLAGVPVVLGTPTYSSATGVLVWSLADGQVIDPGAAGALVVTFEAAADPNAGAGSALEATAAAQSWASKASADSSERREYAPSPTDPATIGIVAPTGLTKAASVQGAAIGDSFDYVITVPGTSIDAALYDVFVLDELPTGYTLVSSANNAVALGTAMTDGSVGQALSYRFEEIPPGAQAVVTLTVRVDNEPANQDSLSLSNTARFTYASGDGLAQSSEFSAAAPGVDVIEPVLTIDKSFDRFVLANASQGLQAGDRVVYNMVITNGGDAPAYDLVIDDLAGEKLINPQVVAEPDNPGAASNLGTAAGVTTFRWNVPGPLDPAGEYRFEVSFELAPSVQPQEMIENGAAITWTSRPGVEPNERTGVDGEGGGLNDYASGENAPVSITVSNVTLTKAEATSGDGSYGPGETVEYDLTFTAGQGTIGDIVLRDQLPAGLVYRSATIAATNYEVLGGGVIGFVSEPAAGATGTLDFGIGDIASSGSDPIVSITIVAYVDDVPGNVDGLSLTNTASLRYADPANPGSVLSEAAQTSPVVTVVEPDLGLSFDAPAAAELGDRLGLVIRVDNAGGGSAWQPTVVALLPVGMREFDPTSAPLSVDILGGRGASLTLDTDYVLGYDQATGRLTLALMGTGGFIAPDEDLVVSFLADVDEFAVDGASLALGATVTQAFSADTSSGPPSGLRTYAAAEGSGTAGTANGDTGDDETDNALTAVAAPVLSLVKSVDSAIAEAGTFLTYQIVIENTGSADSAPSELVDDLDPGIAPGSLRNVTVTPALGSLSVEPSGGVNGSGRLTLGDLVVAASSTVTIAFECGIRRPLPDGTVVRNQASLDVPFYSNPKITDSADPADDDGLESGNDGGQASDDDATLTRIGARPIVSLEKADVDADGAPLVPGDVITYVITGENTGNELAVGATVFDTVPGNTDYVVGSTTLNNVPVADVGGTTALATGLEVQSPGSAAGELAVDVPFTVTFQVTVGEDLAPGAVLTNQAQAVFAGSASGPQAPVLSDDPDTGAGGDATMSVLSGGSSVDATKTVRDVDGGSATPEDELVYTITVRNFGDTEATLVRLVDVIPSGTAYLDGSLVYDADGAGPGAASALTDADDVDAGDFGVTAPGTVTVTHGVLAAGSEFTLEFRVIVDAGLASGTIISNQGMVQRAEGPDEPTDVDGNDADGDEATRLVIGQLPVLALSKTVDDINGGAIAPGDTLRYTLILENVGAADATGVSITDVLPPAGTSYVAGSTMRDGLPLSDGPGSVSPLSGGVSIGLLEDGGQVAFTADVVILEFEPDGTVISNQASFASSNAGSGVSDSNGDDLVETGNRAGDPNDDDPTNVTVGGGGSTVSAVGGYVWRDFDHDRVFTPPAGAFGRGAAMDDQPVSGWTVRLLRTGIVVAQTVTGDDGSWSLRGLAPGHGYDVEFVHPATGTVFGNPASNAPGVSTDDGLIAGLYLAPGGNVLNQNLPLDPSGVVYSSITRLPVAGAVAVLNGPPGFDPLVHLAGGQQGQVTAADGFYQFDLLPGFPAGVYGLEITPPLGYLPVFPSTILPPAAGPLDPTGSSPPFLVVPNNEAPRGAEPTTYFLEFDLAPGDPDTLNNHVPVDPILEGAIAVTKTTPKQNVVRGELVPYMVSVRNLLDVPLPPSEVFDILPPGFKYVAGSATVDGLPMEPATDGRTLTFPGIAFGPGQNREIVLVTVIGAGVGDGRYVNTAVTREPISQERMSNVGTAEVWVVPDPVFDCSDVLGKVFDDNNANGYQDEGEMGLAGVRLVTARGLVVTTDAYGRYHIACPEFAHDLRGSNFIIKVDPRSLPTGYRLTSENPRVIRLTRGRFVEADFGATIGRVLSIELSDKAFVADGQGGERKALDGDWLEAMSVAMDEVDGGNGILRLGYVATTEPDDLVKARLSNALDQLQSLWDKQDRGRLQIEREILRVRTGETPAGSGRSDAAPILEFADAQRGGDVALEAADIRLQADGFDVQPRLNVTAAPRSVAQSGTATFAPYANYWSWIERAEVRVFRGANAGDGEPLDVVPIGPDGVAFWKPGASAEDEIVYVLRVYGAGGEFDETRPQVLRIVPDEAFSEAPVVTAAELLTGYGQSRLARQTIPVTGGAVTVSGRRIAAGAAVLVAGQAVPVSEDGDFVSQSILGEGSHDVTIQIDDGGETVLDVTRRVTFPKDDWFYVAMADLTLGGGSSSETAALVTGDDQYGDSVFVNGRLAFYLKGKIQGKHLLTMSLDTGDRPIDEILSGLDETDPRTLMRFVDPDSFYPVYGDDSTTSWDAPTQGRFYVRLEGPDYRVLWGNFKTQILDTELAQIDRGLYGFQGSWRPSDGSILGGQTSFGEQRTQADIYGASPDSVAAREELRGTGGSLYYLRHRELVLGSERVRVEVRDKDSGIVLSVRALAPQQDYEIDYLAGRILLTSPLASSATDSFAVQNSSLGGNAVYLVARYEFVPQGTDLDALNVGGRISHWLNDSIRMGLTLDRQDQTGGDRNLAGVDVTWRKSAGTYLRGEFAGTEGQGDVELGSLDGGFTFGQNGGVQDEDAKGTAFRVEGAVDFAEESLLGLDGRLTGVVQSRRGGFSGAGQSSRGNSTQVNVSLIEPLGANQSLRVELDMRNEQLRTGTTAIDAQYDRGLGDDWELGLGLRHDEVDAGALSGTGARDGRRSDLALRIGYDGFDRAEAYAFGQLTLDRSRGRSSNNRYGVGGRYALSESLTLDAEVSGGNGGVGVRIGSEWSVTDRTDLYLAYGLDADRSDAGLGAQNGRRGGVLTAGAKHRYSDTVNVFGEERYQHGDGPVGLTHAYGLDYSPNDRWSFGTVLENGRLEEAGQRQIERTGVSLNAGYVREKTKLSSAVEWREDETQSGDRITWLTRNTTSYQANPDWRLLANMDLARSNGGAGTFSNADFTEFGLGWAHRPVAHERWQALFRYSYTQDLPSPGQVDSFGGLLSLAQRSHVFSADANYDLSRLLTVGGKVGMRQGELKTTKGEGQWFDSRAMLYALRADLHVVDGWDALLETRLLDVEAAQDRRLGVLASIWRHVGDNGKLGVGYSFADFSDDLTELDYDYQGWFVNLVGKF